MKKKLIAFLSLVCALCFVFTACGEKPASETKPTETPKNEPAYVGLFSYTKTGGGYTTSAYLNLKEDGTFYFDSEFLANDELGTYSYNEDHTKLTLDATIDKNLSGTFDVEVNDNNVVVIKDVGYFYWEGELLTDDFTYDTVSEKPVEQPIEIVTFFIQGDDSAKLTFQTGSRYELMVSEPKIISSGTYTEETSGDTTTYNLTDTLNGTGATYTFTATYTETDGYSDLKLTGTDIGAEGIPFVHTVEKTVESVFSGNANHGEGDAAVTETVTLTHYADGTFEIEFTTYGDYPAIASGTYQADYTTWAISYDITDGVGKDFVTNLAGVIDPTTYATTVSATIKNDQAALEYTAELALIPAEREALATGTGTVDTEFYGTPATETVTVNYFDGNEFEVEFTTMGNYPAKATGTYEENYDAKTIAYTVTGGEGKDCVTEIKGIFDETWNTVITVKIVTQAGEYEANVTIARAG